MLVGQVRDVGEANVSKRRAIVSLGGVSQPKVPLNRW